MPLARHGLDDTVPDLMFNSLGALAVAAFGQPHLSSVIERVLESIQTDDHTAPK